MPEQPAAAPAQDNTAPAAATNTGAAPAAQPPAAPAPQPAPAQPAQQQQPAAPAQSKPVVEPAKPDEKGKQEAPKDKPAADAVEMLLGDDEGGTSDNGDGAAAPAGEGYELTFPDGAVADAESVAVLNAIGKEFNVTGEKAQALADAATAYGNRRVAAVLDAGKKGYADFCSQEARKTKEFYGPEYKTRLTEAATGLSKLLPEGVTVQGLRKDPNFQALTNVWWFAEMGRRYNKLVSEQPSITGNQEQPKEKDLYSEFD